MKPFSLLSVAFVALGSAGFSVAAWSEDRVPPVVGQGLDVEDAVLVSEVRAPSADITELGEVPGLSVTEVPPPEAPVPIRIGLQAGHWLNQEAPDELSGLRNNGGTRGGGKYEWEVNLEIARLAAALLEEDGYLVDILPATVPQRYRADVFIAIHADGNNDGSVNGYRVAAPRRDYTQRAQEFADVLSLAYGEATGLRRIATVTRRMQGYYAFNQRRYRHAIDESTVGVIIETGFLTSARDRGIIVNDQARAARGIHEGVRQFLGPPLDLDAPVIAETAEGAGAAIGD